MAEVRNLGARWQDVPLRREEAAWSRMRTGMWSVIARSHAEMAAHVRRTIGPPPAVGLPPATSEPTFHALLLAGLSTAEQWLALRSVESLLFHHPGATVKVHVAGTLALHASDLGLLSEVGHRVSLDSLDLGGVLDSLHHRLGLLSHGRDASMADEAHKAVRSLSLLLRALAPATGATTAPAALAVAREEPAWAERLVGLTLLALHGGVFVAGQPLLLRRYAGASDPALQTLGGDGGLGGGLLGGDSPSPRPGELPVLKALREGLEELACTCKRCGCSTDKAPGTSTVSPPEAVAATLAAECFALRPTASAEEVDPLAAVRANAQQLKSLVKGNTTSLVLSLGGAASLPALQVGSVCHMLLSELCTLCDIVAGRSSYGAPIEQWGRAVAALPKPGTVFAKSAATRVRGDGAAWVKGALQLLADAL